MLLTRTAHPLLWSGTAEEENYAGLADLETVMQAELYLPRGGAYAADLAEAAIANIIVWVSIAGNIENVEKISSEAEHLFVPEVEVLEQRHINLAIAGSPFGAVTRAAESKGSWVAIGASSIVHTRCEAGLRRGIRPPPVSDGLIPNDHRAVLIGTAETVTVRVASALTKDGDWEPGIENGGGSNSPSSKDRVEEAVRTAAIRPAASEGKIVHPNEVQAVTDIHARWTVVAVNIESVLVR